MNRPPDELIESLEMILREMSSSLVNEEYKDTWQVRRDARDEIIQILLPLPSSLRNERLTRSVQLLLEFCHPHMEAALASDNVSEEEKSTLRGQLEYFETALTTP